MKKPEIIKKTQKQFATIAKRGRRIADNVMEPVRGLGRNLAILARHPATPFVALLLTIMACKKDPVEKPIPEPEKRTVTFVLSGEDFSTDLDPECGYGETFAAARDSADVEGVGKVVMYANGDFDQVGTFRVEMLGAMMNQFAVTLTDLFSYSDKFDGGQSVINPVWVSDSTSKKFEKLNYSVQPVEQCELHWQTFGKMMDETMVHYDSCENYFLPSCLSIPEYKEVYDKYYQGWNIFIDPVIKTYEDLSQNGVTFSAPEQKVVDGSYRTAKNFITFEQALLDFRAQHGKCFSL